MRMFSYRRLPVIAAGITLILLLQGAVVYLLVRGEQPPIPPALPTLPPEIGSWKQVSDQPMQPEVLAYLKPDTYIDRNYSSKGSASQINLFVAYFKSLKSGYGPHSPSVCLPGAGWLEKSYSLVELPVPGERRSVPAHRFLLEKGDQKVLVFYWYQNGRHVWAEEFWAKLYMLPDLVRHHHSDVALVRVVMPLEGGTTVEAAEAGVSDFVRTVFPPLEEQFASGA